MATEGAPPRRVVLWFRNDLRLRDNCIVAAAAARVRAREADEVLPVFVYDPRAFARSAWGTPKTGGHRAAFLAESVADLRESLRRVGSDLLVAVGAPEEVLPRALEGAAAAGSVVLAQQEVTSEETRAEARVARALKRSGAGSGGAGVPLSLLWGPTLYHRDDLPFGPAARTLPDVFTPFREKVEKTCSVRAELPAPAAGELPLPAAAALREQLSAPLPGWEQLPWPEGAPPAVPQPHPQAALRFKGGESAALARLRHYTFGSDLVATYFETRNGMLGGDYSTKLAPWLSLGALSPRTVYHTVREYEAARGANKSTYWVIFELIWRDFYRFFALKHGDGIFRPGGTANLALPWRGGDELFERWAHGRTGLPLVDANMRELRATGWMSNRGRQNVASYLALDLGVDWRRGADLFEHFLLDYDPCSNWGNWVAAAGLTGGRVNHFNIAKQSKDYDANGDYARAWLPELARVPAARVHEPWLMSKAEQEACGVAIGADYPAPIPAARFARPHGAAGGRVGGDPDASLPGAAAAASPGGAKKAGPRRRRAAG